MVKTRWWRKNGERKVLKNAGERKYVEMLKKKIERKIMKGTDGEWKIDGESFQSCGETSLPIFAETKEKKRVIDRRTDGPTLPTDGPTYPPIEMRGLI